MNIKLIRLQTGEDLIADTKITDNGDLKLENPCMVYVRPSGNSANVGLTRWMPYAEDKIFTIEKRWVVVMADPAEDMANEYNKAFGSGIVLAPAGLKVN